MGVGAYCARGAVWLAVVARTKLIFNPDTCRYYETPTTMPEGKPPGPGS